MTGWSDRSDEPAWRDLGIFSAREQERMQRLYMRFRQAETDAQVAAAALTRSLAQPVPLNVMHSASAGVVRDALAAAATVTTQEMLTVRSVISHALGSARRPPPRPNWTTPARDDPSWGAHGGAAPGGRRSALAAADAAAAMIVPSTDVAKEMVTGAVSGRAFNTDSGAAARGRDLAALGPWQRVGGASDDSAVERAFAVPATYGRSVLERRSQPVQLRSATAPHSSASYLV